MPATVRCPHCQRKLKIKDESLLGRSVKCPGCSKPIALAVPSRASGEEQQVRMELVSEEPPVGTSPRWVPDEPAPRPTPQQPAKAEPAASAPAGDDLPFLVDPAAPLTTTGPGTGAAEKYLRSRRKKNAVLIWSVVGGVMVLGIAVVAFLLTQYKPAPAVDGGHVGAESVAVSADDPWKPYSRGALQGDIELVREFEPTGGEPIELLMMPSGVSVVIHLRPALLWSDEYKYQELRASLTSDLTEWLEAKMVDVCRRRPAQIKELLIGLIFGARGTPPDVCAVVRLQEPEPIVNLIEEFEGTYLHEVPVPRIKVNETHAVLIHDETTFAICPAQYGGELEHWIERPNFEVPDGVADFLRASDRDRLFTVIGELGDLRRHAEMLFPEPARAPLLKVADWLGENIETIHWSVHAEPYVFSQVQLRPGATVGTQTLADAIRRRLDELPSMMWKDVCLKMNPQEMRFRSFIGRFPAMLEAVRQSTVMHTGQRHVTLTTVLPAKAAPNLALGTMFTVNEAARTNFGADVPAVPLPTQPELPATVAERLKLPVDVEFNRTPLEQAFAYLCGEIEVNLAVDGDALKDAGYTKNMPQTFMLGEVPVERAIAEILNRYQEENGQMVIWIDESTKTVNVTTRKFAERDGKTVFEIKLE